MKISRWQKVLGIILILIFALALIKDVIIKSIVTTVGSNVLGAPVRIGSFNLGILSQQVNIKDLRVYNPEGYPKEVFLDVPEISVKCDTGALLAGKIHLPLAILNLKEVIIIKSKDGKLNVDSLKISHPAGKEKEAPSQKPAKEMAMQIDVLKLNIGRVIVKDYTKSDSPTVEVYEIALKDKTFENIRSPRELATVVLVQAMGPTALKSAGLYAAATLLGVGFLPAGIAGAFMSKADSVQIYNHPMDKVYKESINLLKKIGTVQTENSATGEIKGTVNGVDIHFRLTAVEKNKTEARIIARQMMVPKESIAAGIQYQLGQLL